MTTEAFREAVAEAEDFDYNLEHPVLVNPTHQYARQGLDNPDAIYWLELCGHPQGVLMLRWQRLDRKLSHTDGPKVEVVPVDQLPSRLPFHADNSIGPSEYAKRIEARQVGIARRMIS